MRAQVACLAALTLFSACATSTATARPEGAAGQSQVVKPQAKDMPPFKWTHEMLDAKVEGILIVQCRIDDEGAAHDCEVLKPLAHVRSEDVVAWVQAWHFTPATLDGKPVAIQKFTIPIRLKQPTNFQRTPVMGRPLGR